MERGPLWDSEVLRSTTRNGLRVSSIHRGSGPVSSEVRQGQWKSLYGYGDYVDVPGCTRQREPPVHQCSSQSVESILFPNHIRGSDRGPSGPRMVLLLPLSLPSTENGGRDPVSDVGVGGQGFTDEESRELWGEVDEGRVTNGRFRVWGTGDGRRRERREKYPLSRQSGTGGGSQVTPTRRNLGSFVGEDWGPDCRGVSKITGLTVSRTTTGVEVPTTRT